MIYSDGFDYGFDESACERCGGKCCTGESGNIFANSREIEQIRAHFGLNSVEFEAKFLRKVGARFSFKELEFEGGWACIFFDTSTRKCGIYALRPAQCRSFPFWEYYKRRKKDLEAECLGVSF